MDEFIFRIFRQKDSLRYSKDDVRRQEREYHKNMQPTPRVVYVSRPLTTRDLQVERPTDSNDPLNLKAEFFRLKSEVNQLIQEIEPLQHKFQLLLDQQQDREVKTLIYRRKNLTEISIYDIPTKYHVTAQEFFQLQKESDSLKEKIINYRKMFSTTTINKLKKEVKNAEDEVLFITSEIEDLKAEEESVKLEMTNYKLTSEYNKYNKQRKRISKLSETIKNEMNIHHDLKQTYYDLVEEQIDPDNMTPEKEQLLIHRLEDNLTEKQNKLSLAKERYIKMRNSQIKECKELAKIIEDNENSKKITVSTVSSDTTSPREVILWAGYWKRSISKDDIKQNFSEFGKLKSVKINSIENQNFCVYEAIIHYSLFNSNLEIIQNKFSNTGIKVTEYSKRPPPPSPKSPSRSNKTSDIKGSIMEVLTIEPEFLDKSFDSLSALASDLRIPENINAPMPKHKSEVNIEELLNSTSASILKESEESFSSTMQSDRQHVRRIDDESGDVFHSFFTEIGSNFGDAGKPIKKVTNNHEKAAKHNKNKEKQKDDDDVDPLKLISFFSKDNKKEDSEEKESKNHVFEFKSKVEKIEKENNKHKLSFDSSSNPSSPIRGKVSNSVTLSSSVSASSTPKTPNPNDTISLDVFAAETVNQLISPSIIKKPTSVSSTPDKLENEQKKKKEHEKYKELEGKKLPEKQKELEMQKELKKTKE